MPNASSIGTYPRCRGSARYWVLGGGNAIARTAEVGRFVLESAAAVECPEIGGALKAKRHPRGATGVAQCVEQLRGQAVNQVGDDRVALVDNVSGPTAVAAVTILEGPGGHGR